MNRCGFNAKQACRPQIAIASTRLRKAIRELQAIPTASAVVAEPFIVVMLILFPTLTNRGHTRCLSHVGAEGVPTSKTSQISFASQDTVESTEERTSGLFSQRRLHPLRARPHAPARVSPVDLSFITFRRRLRVVGILCGATYPRQFPYFLPIDFIFGRIGRPHSKPDGARAAVVPSQPHRGWQP